MSRRIKDFGEFHQCLESLHMQSTVQNPCFGLDAAQCHIKYPYYVSCCQPKVAQLQKLNAVPRLIFPLPILVCSKGGNRITTDKGRLRRDLSIYVTYVDILLVAFKQPKPIVKVMSKKTFSCLFNFDKCNFPSK